MNNEISLNLNGRAYPLAKCNNLFATQLKNADEAYDKITLIISDALARSQPGTASALTDTQKRFLAATGTLEVFFNSLNPLVAALHQRGYPQDMVDTFVGKVDDAALELVQEVVDAANAVMAEAAA